MSCADAPAHGTWRCATLSEALSDFGSLKPQIPPNLKHHTGVSCFSRTLLPKQRHFLAHFEHFLHHADAAMLRLRHKVKFASASTHALYPAEPQKEENLPRMKKQLRLLRTSARSVARPRSQNVAAVQAQETDNGLPPPDERTKWLFPNTRRFSHEILMRNLYLFPSAEVLQKTSGHLSKTVTKGFSVRNSSDPKVVVVMSCRSTPRSLRRSVNGFPTPVSHCRKLPNMSGNGSAPDKVFQRKLENSCMRYTATLPDGTDGVTPDTWKPLEADAI